jgi:hypothetical protein
VATGVVVGALTLGSGSPNLVRGLGDVPRQVTIIVTSVLAVASAIVVVPVRTGPGAVPTPPLDLGAAARTMFRDRPFRLATAGYLGHMWELYALWAWMATFYTASRTISAGAAPSVSETGVVVFAAVGVAGMAGSVVAGRLADQLGRLPGQPVAYAATTPILMIVLLAPPDSPCHHEGPPQLPGRPGGATAA